MARTQITAKIFLKLPACRPAPVKESEPSLSNDDSTPITNETPGVQGPTPQPPPPNVVVNLVPRRPTTTFHQRAQFEGDIELTRLRCPCWLCASIRWDSLVEHSCNLKAELTTTATVKRYVRTRSMIQQKEDEEKAYRKKLAKEVLWRRQYTEMAANDLVWLKSSHKAEKRRAAFTDITEDLKSQTNEPRPVKKLRTKGVTASCPLSFRNHIVPIPILPPCSQPIPFQNRTMTLQIDGGLELLLSAIDKLSSDSMAIKVPRESAIRTAVAVPTLNLDLLSSTHVARETRGPTTNSTPPPSSPGQDSQTSVTMVSAHSPTSPTSPSTTVAEEVELTCIAMDFLKMINGWRRAFETSDKVQNPPLRRSARIAKQAQVSRTASPPRKRRRV